MFKKAKENKKGFTLAELLIVVAIIAVLVAISIPIFTSQLEKSREAVDLANLRSAYAECSTAVLTGETSSNNVKKGDVLGIQGTTGNSTGIHLHFEMHIQDGENKILVNPRDWFDFPKQGEYRQIDNNENKEQEENNEESKRD